MEDEKKKRSRFEEVEEGNASLPRELYDFLRHNKKWWLFPILGTFLAIGALLLLSNTAAAPFIYTLF